MSRRFPISKVDAGPLPDVRYAGASGDFNPIHIDEELRHGGRPARPHPPRPVDDVAGRARGRASGGRASSDSRSSSAAWASPSRRSPSPRPSRDEADGVAHDRDRGRAGRPPDHPQGQGRGAFLESDGDALPAPGAPARQSGRRLRRVPASPWARRRSPPTPDVALRPVDDPQRARGARGAGAARAPAHLRRARADRLGLPLLRRPRAAQAHVDARSRRARSS